MSTRFAIFLTANTFLSFAAGIFFMLVLLAIGCYIAFRPSPQDIPQQSMWIFRVVMALSGAAFAVILTGFLDISAQSGAWKIRTGGGLAVFVLLYLVDPPKSLSKPRPPSPKKPRRIPIPPESNDKTDKTG
jgi:hypothetical protein